MDRLKTTSLPIARIPDLREILVIVEESGGRVVCINKAAARFFKKPPAALIGHACPSLLPQAQAGLYDRKRRAALRSRRAVAFELTAKLSGRDRRLRCSLQPFSDPATGQQLLISLIAIADGGRGRTPAPGAMPDALLRQLHSAPHINILWKGLDNTVRWINEACARAIKVSQAELIGARFDPEAYNPALAEKWAQEDRELQRTGQPLVNIIESGNGRWFHIDKIPILGRDGKLESILIIALPVAERQASEIHLQQSAWVIGDAHQKVIKMQAAVDSMTERLDEAASSPAGGYRAEIKRTVAPYVDQLCRMRLEGKAGKLCALIDRNLKKLTDPFTAKMAASLARLSPVETQIAQLVRDGKTNKEIAALLNVSQSTIFTHRNHIRTKLGLKHQKTNLRSYLDAL
ncbi:MAG: helix-turn-helix transcriptional regulator [Desulfobacterales bacterium]|jgi:DNA-binding CsgD family transcriptional regulator/PAS domain-containing protein|nr:helix-turn-helix transcriptional regulator [Desulfobacterales bacterium]